MSAGFAGSHTRGLSELDRAVETRMKSRKNLDVFTDDFSPPGTAESFPGANRSKRDAPYGDKHDDYSQAEAPALNDGRQKKLNGCAGDVSDQEPMDKLDETEHQMEQPIKKESDQFPGAKHMSESFDDKIEKRMKRLSKISWRADNVDGEKGEGITRYAEYEVHANDKGWIVARGGRVFGSGKSSGIDDAKLAVQKFLNALEIRGQ